jgi:hypothetical protein
MFGVQMLARLLRARDTFRATRDARGWAGALVLLVRTIASKGPLLIRQIRAGKGAGAVRSEVDRVRTGSASPHPYIAFALTGGLGDYIVIARFVRDLAVHAGGIHFDIFSPSPTVAAWAFGKIAGFHAAYYDILFEHVVQEYDVGIRANQSVFAYFEHARWRRLAEHPNLVQAIDSMVRFRPKLEIFIERHPWFDNFLAKTAVFANFTRRNFLHTIAGLQYGGDTLAVPRDDGVLSRLGLRSRQYVTIHNGFDTGFVISGRRATKCYPHFGSVVTHLRRQFPDLRFVQVGAATSEAVDECDLILLNKTTLDEVAGLLGGAVMHIDNEGGLVHLAACLGTRSTVVFGPTPSDYFGYPSNVNVDPPVCGNCWWMTRTWMDWCVKGYETPRCMTEQQPELVANRAAEAISRSIFSAREHTLDGSAKTLTGAKFEEVTLR